ncbi:hypothetical protein [Caproiciproducens galactitolivorans]|uniref:hypothetical protein n=1 Tax=Caproiciproducens galactitolivorans TaxID=642589 RepID=UPI003AF36F2A
MDLPLGFGMALAQNEEAMEYFSALPRAKQQEILDHTHEVNSNGEMHEFVASIKNKY